jgi:hypothetical protein
VRCIIEGKSAEPERFSPAAVLRLPLERANLTEAHMHGLIYLIGLIVVILAILSFFGLR